MKIRGFLSTVFATMFLCALQLTISTAAAASGGYSAKLISPRLGQVLYPGQHIRIQWEESLPKTQAGGCEMELLLSLDGGRTFSTCITPVIAPNTKYYDWVVPNTPSNAAVLDIRFGCEWYYPESASPQPASTFVIAKTAQASH
jgi:hypothetical protein